MKIDIQYYIRQVLREQRKVYVPQIGTFTLLQSPARLSDDKLTIYPPALSIDFHDGASDDDSLKTYIADTGKFSKSKIETAISDFTESTFNKLINVNASDIDGVGTLIKQENQESVLFKPSLEAFTKEFKGFNELSIKPVERIKEDNIVAHAINTSNISARASSPFAWLQPVIAGILIALLAIFIVKTCASWDDGTYRNPDESIGATQGVEESDNQSDNLIELNRNSEDLTELDKKYEEVDNMLEGKAKINLPETKVKEELSELENKTNITNTDEASKVNSSIVESTNKEKTSISNKPKGIFADIIPESGKCVIILGSFKKASNVTKMMSIIERDGKKVYTSQYNGKTRVGFKFDCSGVDIDTYLNDVRKRLSSKAWYLDPTISIPYK